MWARSQGLAPDPAGYLAGIAANLFQPLSDNARRGLERGSGSELCDTRSGPAKLKALHSSAALVVNFFDYWTTRDRRPLQLALSLAAEITSIGFEERFPTGLPGIPPHVDVLLPCSSAAAIAIESKFSEWLTLKGSRTQPFSPTYFPETEPLWERQGLPRCQTLAEDIQTGVEGFCYLAAAQLLKHGLGLAVRFGPGFSLHYLFYDCFGPEADAHQTELARFANLLGTELNFRAISYQDLFGTLEAAITAEHADYLDYLRIRYFGAFGDDHGFGPCRQPAR